MRLVLMGPPGAGKGTQAALVAREFGIPHISTGDIFRANVAAGTVLGQEAQRYLDAGEYVPDGITNGMVRDRLAQDDCRPGFLLDGYPRTVEQVHELDAMLRSGNQVLDRVIALLVNRDEVVARLLQRATDQGRSDDSEEVVRRRLDIYDEATAPLIAAYADRGILIEIDGMGSVEDVTGRITLALLP